MSGNPREISRQASLSLFLSTKEAALGKENLLNWLKGWLRLAAFISCGESKLVQKSGLFKYTGLCIFNFFLYFESNTAVSFCSLTLSSPPPSPPPQNLTTLLSVSMGYVYIHLRFFGFISLPDDFLLQRGCLVITSVPEREGKMANCSLSPT